MDSPDLTNPVQTTTGPPLGSSPRGRGTLTAQAAHQLDRRVIPARAGNTRRRTRAPPRSPVHPRAGGEHISSAGAASEAIGSSPRGRGTQSILIALPPVGRFIPARAGNTVAPRRARRSDPVHPRAGGEHGPWVTAIVVHAGSSPRGRGTRPLGDRNRGPCRFIPARAGNTWTARTAIGLASVHPRAGGEHDEDTAMGHPSNGSSPRGRGTLFSY